MEQAWEIEEKVKKGPPSDEGKMARMQYSATNAIARYTACIENDILRKVENSSATFMRKRGRERMLAATPQYPDSDSDEDDEAEQDHHQKFVPNKAQRAFIDACPVPDSDEETEPPPKRKRRNDGAKVSLHGLVYVRDEADIDELRHQAPPITSKALQGASFPGLNPPPILRTSRIRKTSRPRRGYYTLNTKKIDGPRRLKCDWYRKGRYYKPGRWAVQPESENVDTSGMSFEEDMEYMIYVHRLEYQAELDDKKLEADAAEEPDTEMTESEEEILDELKEDLMADLQQVMDHELDELYGPVLKALAQGDEAEGGELVEEVSTVEPFSLERVASGLVKRVARALKAFPQAARYV